MRVKICGITQREDALAAEAAGADAVGFVFVEASKRFVSPEHAAELSASLGPFISKVGVFVDSPLSEVLAFARMARLDGVQLQGQEDAAYAEELRREFKVIKAFSFRPELSLAELEAFPADAIHLDGMKPGSGEVFEWKAATFLKPFPRLILAGGLNPANVETAIKSLEPYGVDVSSGVELEPGIKDRSKVQDFVRRAKQTKLSTVIHSPVDNCG